MAKDGKHLQHVSISQTGAGSVTVVNLSDAWDSAKIVSIFVVVDTDDATLQLLSAGNALSGAMPFLKGSGIGAKGSVEEPLFKTEAGEDFVITSVGGGFKGWASYYVEGEG